MRAIDPATGAILSAQPTYRISVEVYLKAASPTDATLRVCDLLADALEIEDFCVVATHEEARP